MKDNRNNAFPERSVSVENIYRNISNLDQLSLKVIRARLYIEASMDEAISQKLRDWPEIRDHNINYRKKKGILNDNFDLGSDLNRNIQLVNEVRNIMAHNLEWRNNVSKVRNKIDRMSLLSLGERGQLTEVGSSKLDFTYKSTATIYELFEILEDKKAEFKLKNC